MSFFLRLVGVRESDPPMFSLFRLGRSSYISCRSVQYMTFTEMHVKWSVTSADRLGPDILIVSEKGTSFTSCAFTCEGSWLVVRLKCAPN